MTPPGRCESDADRCRRLGWKRGTVLASGGTYIQITAVGDSYVLAREIVRDGLLMNDEECDWTLAHRMWRRARIDEPKGRKR